MFDHYNFQFVELLINKGESIYFQIEFLVTLKISDFLVSSEHYKNGYLGILGPLVIIFDQIQARLFRQGQSYDIKA